MTSKAATTKADPPATTNGSTAGVSTAAAKPAAKAATPTRPRDAAAPPELAKRATPAATPAGTSRTKAKSEAPAGPAPLARAKAGSAAKQPAPAPEPATAVAHTAEAAPKATSETPAKAGAKSVSPSKATPAPKPSPTPEPTLVPSPRPTYADDVAFLDAQRASLEIERATYLEQARSLRAEAESLVEEMEPGDVQFDEESGEGGTVTVDRERDLALSAQALAAVDEIVFALEKLDNGRYGICEGCGELIVTARLEALPYARLCIACKSGGLSRR